MERKQPFQTFFQKPAHDGKVTAFPCQQGRKEVFPMENGKITIYDVAERAGVRLQKTSENIFQKS